MADDGEYRFSWENVSAPSGFWITVRGPGLPPGKTQLRINRHADGRYVFTGLVIGEEGPEPKEVTPQTLRSVPINAIRAALFKHYAPPGAPLELLTMPEGAREVADLYADRAGVVATGPSPGPSEASLRAFADTYQKEHSAHPQRAMTAAAQAHKISRATANRWAARCRQLGYLPGPDVPSASA